MTTLKISLPENVHALAEARANEAGHANIEAYVQALIRADAEQEIDALLEGELLKGLSGPAHPRTAADWDLLRSRI